MNIDRGKRAKQMGIDKPSVARQYDHPERSKLSHAPKKPNAKKRFGYRYTYTLGLRGLNTPRSHDVYKWYETEAQRDQAFNGLRSCFWFQSKRASNLQKIHR